MTARKHRNSTDLTALICFSEAVTNQLDASLVSIRTNLALAIRLEIPNGKGAFLLDTKLGATNQGSVGVIISSQFAEAEKINFLSALVPSSSCWEIKSMFVRSERKRIS